jgi:hypothetical protein
MDKAPKQSQESCKPAGPSIPVRPGGSGEGSRSALEHLIQQERKRSAHSPREAAAEPAPAPPDAP